MQNKRAKWPRLAGIVLLPALLTAVPACKKAAVQLAYSGIFYANDCGESHGGFEWAAEYSVTLEISGSEGTLTLVLKTGVGDLLQVHNFSITEFSAAANELNFKINGRQARLVWTEKDEIWSSKYDRYFTGSRSQNSAEQKGNLPIEPFTGFAAHFYIEMHLRAG